MINWFRLMQVRLRKVIFDVKNTSLSQKNNGILDNIEIILRCYLNPRRTRRQVDKFIIEVYRAT